MKKIFLLFALAAFISSTTVVKAASFSSMVKIECDKCGGKDGKCTKECKDGKKSKCCKDAETKACSHGTEGAASTGAEAPKSCGAKKSCCKSKAKSEANAAETAPEAK